MASKGPFSNKRIDERFGRGCEARPERTHGAERERVGENRPWPGVCRRVGFEDQARLTPGFVRGEIGMADTAARAERRGIVECRMHLGVAGRRIAIPAREPDDGAGVSQFGLGRKWILEEVTAERIDVADRNAGRHRSRLRPFGHLHDAAPLSSGDLCGPPCRECATLRGQCQRQSTWQERKGMVERTPYSRPMIIPPPAPSGSGGAP